MEEEKAYVAYAAAGVPMVPHLEVPDQVLVRLVRVLAPLVAPVRILALLLILLGILISLLARRNGNQQLLFGEAPVVVQVEQAKREAHAAERARQHERGEAHDELAEVDRAVAVHVQYVNHALQVHVYWQSKHVRELRGINLWCCRCGM